MPAAFRSSSNTTYASRTNTTVTAPAGIVDGDKLLYLQITGAASLGAPTATPPSGFVEVPGTWPMTLVDTGNFQVKAWLWYKDASGESGNYTATHAASNSQGAMWCVSGGASGAPAVTQNSGTGSTSTATGLTTSGDDALISFFGHDWAVTSNNLSPPTGTTPTFTERIDTTLIYLATGVLTPAGATGNKSHTNNSNVSTPWAAYSVAVEAAVVAVVDTESSRPRFGFNPSRHPNKHRRLRATEQAPFTNEEGVVPQPEEDLSPHSRFGWSPARRPMARRRQRASAPDTQIDAGVSQLVTPDTASLILTTFAPDVLTPVLVTPGLATLTITTFAPTVSTPVLVVPGVASLTITTFAPTVSTPVLATPGAASLILTTFAPDVSATSGLTLIPPTASLVLSTFAPTITLSNNQSVTPGTAALVLSTFAPTVLTPVTVTPITASLALSTFAPLVAITNLVTPGTAALTLSTFAPTISITNHQVVIPSLATLTLSTFAPAVSATAHQTVTPGTTALVLSTFAPNVSAGLPLQNIVYVSLAFPVLVPCAVSMTVNTDLDVEVSNSLARTVKV